MARDPFAELGLAPDATETDIREARRRLAKKHHPDAGGDVGRMRSVNAAAADALRARSAAPPVTAPVTAPGSGVVFDAARDVPSFTVEALPVETFEALVLVAAEIGEVVDGDPPYRLDVMPGSTLQCWCRLEIVPDAGASTVNLSIGPNFGAVDEHRPPPMEVVRDLWIDGLNALDWPETT